MPSASALNLAQYAMISNDPVVKTVTMGLIENNIVLQDIPLVTKASLKVNGVRWTGSLPTVNWQPLNTDPIVTSGTPSAYEEQAYLIRNAIDVDRLFLLDENQISDPRALQLEAYLKSVAYDYNDKFINNVVTTGDANAPIGIRSRLDNPGTFGVKIYTGATGDGVTQGKAEGWIDAGGAAASLKSGTVTATTANLFVQKMDQLLWSVDSIDGTNVIIYMNEVLKRRFEAGLRLMGSSALDITQDNFGRRIMSFRNAIIRDIGYKADQNTRIITTTETAAGANGASVFTSMYAVKADTSHLFAWQMEPIRAQDIGLIGNGGAMYRTAIDWATGLVQPHPRAIARLYDIEI